jgi:arylsulfatase A-like enzyme
MRAAVCRPWAVAVLITWLACDGPFIGLLQSSAAEVTKPNFLLIAIDDLNDYVGVLDGHPNARTPRIDQLAEEGVLFTNAHCNSPVCNPSRTSLWTGLRPTTTGITSNRHGWFREQPDFRDVVSLPQALFHAGYATNGFGKLFHVGLPRHSTVEWQRANIFEYGPRQKPKLNYQQGDAITDWGVPAGDSEQAASFDPVIANRVIDFLSDTHRQPFCLGCGFYRPHTPLYASQRWYDSHPLNGIVLPETLPNDNDDLVYFGVRERRPQDVEAPGLFTQEWAESKDHWRSVLQAYLACTSAMDYQLGRLLDALEESRYRQNTYVILFSDHGWHLGEKRHWGKAALWEQTTRIPLIIAGPKLPRGRRCDRPVDLLCIYPTIMELADVAPPPELEGHSLRPLLEDPTAEWPHAVLTTFVDHHALRTQRWRYIRYATGEEELYDHSNDADEFENLAVTQAKSGSVRATLKRLRAEMRTLLP